MAEIADHLQHLTAENVAIWYQDDLEMVVGDALDPSTSAPMIIGFARYRKGTANQVTLPYDEALIITRGVVTVRRADGVATARAGEVIFHVLRQGRPRRDAGRGDRQGQGHRRHRPHPLGLGS